MPQKLKTGSRSLLCGRGREKARSVALQAAGRSGLRRAGPALHEPVTWRLRPAPASRAGPNRPRTRDSMAPHRAAASTCRTKSLAMSFTATEPVGRTRSAQPLGWGAWSEGHRANQIPGPFVCPFGKPDESYERIPVSHKRPPTLADHSSRDDPGQGGKPLSDPRSPGKSPQSPGRIRTGKQRCDPHRWITASVAGVKGRRARQAGAGERCKTNDATRAIPSGEPPVAAGQAIRSSDARTGCPIGHARPGRPPAVSAQAPDRRNPRRTGPRSRHGRFPAPPSGRAPRAPRTGAAGPPPRRPGPGGPATVQGMQEVRDKGPRGVGRLIRNPRTCVGSVSASTCATGHSGRGNLVDVSGGNPPIIASCWKQSPSNAQTHPQTRRQGL
jgi:hypothetical protein